VLTALSPPHPPTHTRSIKVFSEDQVLSIVDHVNNAYYRHFLLFKYIFGCRVVRQVRQVLPHQVEYATPNLHALGSGIFVPKD